MGLGIIAAAVTWVAALATASQSFQGYPDLTNQVAIWRSNAEESTMKLPHADPWGDSGFHPSDADYSNYRLNETEISVKVSAQQYGVLSTRAPAPRVVMCINNWDDQNSIVREIRQSAELGSNYIIISWLYYDGPHDGAKFWSELSDDLKKETLDYIHGLGAKLLVTASGAPGEIQGYMDSGTPSAEEWGRKMGEWVVGNMLDGIDVLVTHTKKDQSVPWIISATRAIRSAIGNDRVMSHSPAAPLFSCWWDQGYHKIYQECRDDIDWLNVQYFNQGEQNQYNTYEKLFSDAGGGASAMDIKADPNLYGPMPDTRVFELNKRGIPLEKIVVGKPRDGAAKDGYVPLDMLLDIHKRAIDERKFNGGALLWNFEKCNLEVADWSRKFHELYFGTPVPTITPTSTQTILPDPTTTTETPPTTTVDPTTTEITPTTTEDPITTETPPTTTMDPTTTEITPTTTETSTNAGSILTTTTTETSSTATTTEIPTTTSINPPPTTEIPTTTSINPPPTTEISTATTTSTVSSTGDQVTITVTTTIYTCTETPPPTTITATTTTPCTRTDSIVSTTTVVPTTTGPCTRHVVQSGDTLCSLAQDLSLPCVPPYQWTQIRLEDQATPATNPITVGQVLYLCPDTTTTTTATTATLTSTIPPPPPPTTTTTSTTIPTPTTVPDRKSTNRVEVYINSQLVEEEIKGAIDAGATHVILGFWRYVDGGIYAAKSWNDLSAGKKADLIALAHSKGVALMLGVGGVGEPVRDFIQSGLPTGEIYGKMAAEYAVSLQLDGLEFYLSGMTDLKDKGPDWVIAANQAARKVLGPDRVISHAPQAVYFTTTWNKGYQKVYAACNDDIDWLSIQYYDQGPGAPDYDTYESLFSGEGVDTPWNTTSIKPLSAEIPMDKLVIGKYYTVDVDSVSPGYVAAALLVEIMDRAKTDLGWKAGVQIWKYQLNDPVAEPAIRTISQSLRPNTNRDLNDRPIDGGDQMAQFNETGDQVIDCTWSEWGDWSLCNCNSKLAMSFRNASSGCVEFSRIRQSACSCDDVNGMPRQIRPIEDCVWADWNEWGVCDCLSGLSSSSQYPEEKCQIMLHTRQQLCACANAAAIAPNIQSPSPVTTSTIQSEPVHSQNSNSSSVTAGAAAGAAIGVLGLGIVGGFLWKRKRDEQRLIMSKLELFNFATEEGRGAFGYSEDQLDAVVSHYNYNRSRSAFI